MSPERRRDSSRVVAAVLFSAAVHLVLTIFVGPQRDVPPFERASPKPAATVEIGLELPEAHALAASAAGASAGVRVQAEGAVPAAEPGGERTPRPDDGRAGRGGERHASEAAVNLAPRDDEALLSPIWRSRLERSQVSRQHTGEARRSREDDRVSPRAMMLTFVADGAGRPDLRPVGVRRIEMRPGAARRRARSLAEPFGPGMPVPAAVRMREAVEARAGRSGRAAENGLAGPNALQGRQSSPANERGAQQDTVTSEQEAHNRERSLLRASGPGGEQGGGRGGEPGSTSKPAAGGQRGPGFASRPNGTGRGPGHTLDPADARRRSYLRNIASRIHARWTVRDFPQQAVLEGRQGYTIVSFVVARDGSVSAVRITRPSGFPGFDQKMRQAVFRAAPFGPLPPEMMPVLHHQHEFIVSNPAVRPRRR